MAKILPDISRTFSEYLLIPRLTEKQHVASNVSLKTPIAKFKKGETPRLSINIPFVSASMQAVSGVKMAIALARRGGLAFIFCSQTISQQASMVFRVNHHKAGFVDSDSNVKPETPLKDTISLIHKTGHSTVAITHDGTNKGIFLGILTDKDFWEYEDDLEKPVSQFMTPKEKVIHGIVGISLHDANSLLHKHKKECLPILDKDGNLDSLVFKKDFFNYLWKEDDCYLEVEPLLNLTKDGELMVYTHNDFWQCVDTYRELELLNNYWKSGDIPWKVW